jgi:hypothetical protein
VISGPANAPVTFDTIGIRGCSNRKPAATASNSASIGSTRGE